MFKKFAMFVTTLAFCASPAAFGAPLTAEALYKQTYVEMKKGTNSLEVVRHLVEGAKANGLTVKQVLESAVNKGWMSQEQLDTVMEIAAKNSKEIEGKKVLTPADLQTLSKSLQGQVTGAGYHCGYYSGCYYSDAAVIVLLTFLILAILCSAAYAGSTVIVWY